MDSYAKSQYTFRTKHDACTSLSDQGRSASALIENSVKNGAALGPSTISSNYAGGGKMSDHFDLSSSFHLVSISLNLSRKNRGPHIL